MTLYRVNCRCGFVCYRMTADTTGRECPACKQSGLVASAAPNGEPVSVQEPNGKTSTWSWNDSKWVTA